MKNGEYTEQQQADAKPGASGAKPRGVGRVIAHGAAGASERRPTHSWRKKGGVQLNRLEAVFDALKAAEDRARDRHAPSRPRLTSASTDGSGTDWVGLPSS